MDYDIGKFFNTNYTIEFVQYRREYGSENSGAVNHSKENRNSKQNNLF